MLICVYFTRQPCSAQEVIRMSMIWPLSEMCRPVYWSKLDVFVPHPSFEHNTCSNSYMLELTAAGLEYSQEAHSADTVGEHLLCTTWSPGSGWRSAAERGNVSLTSRAMTYRHVKSVQRCVNSCLQMTLGIMLERAVLVLGQALARVSGTRALSCAQLRN
jgi:hypothetical protein